MRAWKYCTERMASTSLNLHTRKPRETPWSGTFLRRYWRALSDQALGFLENSLTSDALRPFSFHPEKTVGDLEVRLVKCFAMVFPDLPPERVASATTANVKGWD